MSKGDALDPKGLIGDAYAIEGIAAPECRSIFLDWALSMPADKDPCAAITMLLERHAQQPRDHPMTQTLREGLAAPTAPRRRGGRRTRIAN